MAAVGMSSSAVSTVGFFLKRQVEKKDEAKWAKKWEKLAKDLLATTTVWIKVQAVEHSDARGRIQELSQESAVAMEEFNDVIKDLDEEGYLELREVRADEL